MADPWKPTAPCSRRRPRRRGRRAAPGLTLESGSRQRRGRRPCIRPAPNRRPDR